MDAQPRSAAGRVVGSAAERAASGVGAAERRASGAGRRRRAGVDSRPQPGSPPTGQWTPPPGGPGPSWKGPDTTNAGIVGGFVLVGIGVWFLVDQYVHIDWQLVWPVVVILIGVGADRRGDAPEPALGLILRMEHA